MRRSTLLTGLVLLLGALGDAEANGASRGNCSRWVGTYVAQLDETNSFVGDGKLELEVRRGSVGWTIRGGTSPEILAAAESYRCTARQLTARFSASPQHEGRLILTKRGASYTLDMSEFHPLKHAPRNYIGYAPNRPIAVQRLQGH